MISTFFFFDLFIFLRFLVESLLFSFQCSCLECNPFRPHSKPNSIHIFSLLPRKEVIHPHVPVGIPCYDFTPIINPTLDSSFLAVRPPASGVINSRGVTGGVYKARERIHRDMLIRDY